MRIFSHRRGSPARFVPLGCAIVALALANCGGQENPELIAPPSNAPLEGEINVDRFEIPEGRARTVIGDLVVTAADEVVIAGTMRVEPGVSVSLVTKGEIRITGSIEPDTAAAKQSAFAGTGAPRRDPSDAGLAEPLEGAVPAAANSFVLVANAIRHSGRIEITPDTDLLAAGVGGLLYAPTSIRLEGPVTTKGLAGTEARDGGPSGSIEIGTDRAVRIARDLIGGSPTTLAAPFATVLVSDTVRTGAGGRGGSDHSGTVTVGQTLTFKASSGGDAGDILIEAITGIDLTGGALIAGDGGTGGDVGGPESMRATDGDARGESGQNLRAETGHGGDGGSVVLESASIVGVAAAKPGRPGPAGSAFVAAGSGGPGGGGGTATILVGAPGAAGTGPGGSPGISPVTRIELKSGGNGGDSDSAGMAGGNGGAVVIGGRDNRAAALHWLVIDAYGNAGQGFDGCVMEPEVPGTGGGDAGTVAGQDGYVAIYADVLVNVLNNGGITNSFSGGNGGDGLTAGSRGFGGLFIKNQQAPQKVGEDGISGVTCPP
jgi:hypothetical protein